MRDYLYELGLCAAVVIGLISLVPLTYYLHPPAQAQTPEQQVAGMSVRVFTDKGHGSGVIVGKNLVLTNRHVAKEMGDDIKIALPNGDEKPGKPITLGDGFYDLALIETDTGSAPAADIDCKLAQPGEAVFAYGNPLWLAHITTWGRIAGGPVKANDEVPIQDAVPMDLTINPGNSGGGVWATRAGAPVLVGVSTALVPMHMSQFSVAPSGLTLMLPSSAICHFLGRA